jgi:HK97 gp10 family phage protein
MFDMKVKGLEELRQTLKNLGEDITDQMEEATMAGADVVVREAKQNSRKGGEDYPHRRTGTLMRSIKVLDTRKKSNWVEVDAGSAVEYARRLEYGFVGKDKLGRRYNQQPRAFLRPALENNEDEIEKAVEAKIREIVGRYK